MVLKRLRRGHRGKRQSSLLPDHQDDVVIAPPSSGVANTKTEVTKMNDEEEDVEVYTNDDDDDDYNNNFVAAADNDYSPEDDAIIQPQLARAWFARRKNDLLQRQQQQTQAAASLTAVDVDNNHTSVWDLADEPIARATPRNNKNTSSSARKRKIMPSSSCSSPENSSENFGTDESHMSSAISIATSDCTPIMSNQVLPKSSSSGSMPQPNKILNVQTQDTDDDEEAATSSNTTPIQQDTRQPPPPQQQPQTHRRCGKFLDWNTRQGKLVYILLLLLFLSLVTLGVAAFISRDKRNKNDDEDVASKSTDAGNNEFNTAVPVPTTPAPSAVVGGDSVSIDSTTTTAPPTAAAVENVAASSEPSSAANDDEESFTSTRSPSTLAPTNGASRLVEETRAPATPAPTTLAPTLFPSAAPSSNKPTLRPTTSSPTVTPSAAPTVSLGTLVNNLAIVGKLEGFQNGDTFGLSVALSANGNVLAVGAPQAPSPSTTLSPRAGSVYVFAYDGTTWQTRGFPIEGRNDDDLTGSVVSLSDDGRILAISEPGHGGGGVRAGNVRVYSYNPVSKNYDIQLGQEIQGPGSTALLGVSMQLSASGKRLVIGAPYYSGALRFQGEVVVYEIDLSTNEWKLLGTPLVGTESQDWFGMAIDIHEDDEILTIVASAPHNEGTGGYIGAYQYTLNSNANEWKKLGSNQMTNKEIVASSSAFSNDRFGGSLALSKAGEDTFRLAVGIPGRDGTASRADVGMAIVYELNTRGSNSWSVMGTPVASQGASDGTGTSVQLVNGGNILLVGSPGANGAGNVRLFRYNAKVGSFEPRSSDQLAGVEDGEQFGFALAATNRPEDGRLVIAVGAIEGLGLGAGYVTVLEERRL